MVRNNAPTENRVQQPARPPRPEASPSTTSQIRQYIVENPTTSVFLGLGVGLGVGVLLGCLLKESTEGLFSRETSFMDRIGSQVRDSIHDVIPASWRNRLQS
jgi:hypothetical protein